MRVRRCHPERSEGPALRETSRSLAALGMTIMAGCASIARPPGGPVDTEPPEVVSASIDTNAVGVKAGKLELRFSEVVAERPSGAGGTGAVTLDAIVLVSPRTGMPKVEWHRESITIEPRGGFRPNTTYRITLLPGLADIRGNVNKTARSFVFSTGPAILPYAILGRVFDWQTGMTATGAIVEAVANAGTADSSIYIAVADSIGQFDVGPLGPGKYLVRTFIDADRNRDRGVLEKWDTLTVTVTDHRPSIELLAAQRDTAPIGITKIDGIDSLSLRVTLDKPFDPRTQLASVLVSVQRADSSQLTIASVVTGEQAAAQRPDTAAAVSPTPARPVTPPVAPPPSARPPAARPSIPPPQDAIVIRLQPTTPVRPGERYVVTIRGLRNLAGTAGTATGVFEAPKPPARPPE